MRPAQIAASAACTQAEGSFRVEVFVRAFGGQRFCTRVHLQTYSRRTEKRCCFVLAAAAGPGFPAGTLQDIGKGARGSVLRRLSLSGRMQGSVRPARRALRKRLRRAFLFGERLHVIPAAFVPQYGAPRRLSHAERLRRRRPAAICVRCQLICFSARGAPYPAPRFCFARRIRSAAGARLAPSQAPAFSCPSCAALRRRRPAAICVRCQLICSSARGAPYLRRGSALLDGFDPL